METAVKHNLLDDIAMALPRERRGKYAWGPVAMAPRRLGKVAEDMRKNSPCKNLKLPVLQMSMSKKCCIVKVFAVEGGRCGHIAAAGGARKIWE